MSDFCPKCGQPIDKNTGKCPNSCFIPSPQGFPLQNYAKNQRPPIPPAENNVNNSYKKPKSKSNLPIIISASVAAGVILIGAVAAIALSSSSSRPISAGNNNFEIGHSYAFESKNPKITKKNTVTTPNTTNKAVTTVPETTYTPAYLPATDEDFKELEKMMTEFDCLPGIFEYSSSDPDALETVMDNIMSMVFTSRLYLYYFPNSEEIHYCTGSQFKDMPKSERDPLNHFEDYFKYSKIPADNMDWLLKNVFNVAPDRSVTIKSNNNIRVYYYDGYYYSACGEGGDISGEAHIINKEYDEYWNYILDINLVYDKYEVHYDMGTYRVICHLSYIDGKRQWTFTSIKQTDKGNY